MVVKTPWYKKVAIWFVVAGAMIAGALIMFGRWVRQNLTYSPPQAPPAREAVDQELEDEIKTIERDINDIIKTEDDRVRKIGKNLTIHDINGMLSDAREERNIAGDRRADRHNDGD